MDKPKEEKGNDQNLLIWQVATGIFALLLIVSVFYGMTKKETPVQTQPGTCNTEGNKSTTGIGLNEAATKTMKYINDNLMQPGSTATMKSIKEQNGVYNMTIEIAGKQYDTYISSDGTLFFPQAFDLNAQIEQPSETETEPQTVPQTATPSVGLYTMSYCPYGNQAEQVMYPVYQLLKNKVEIEPHYVIYSNYGGGGPNYCLDNESKYCSMHGIQELHQDVRELCIYKYQKDKYWDFLMAVNSQCSSQNVDSCWEAVATAKGIDTSKIKTCQQNEAVALLQKEVALNAQYGVQGSPTLVINGVQYNGARTPDGYKQGICSAFTTAPTECSQTLGAGNTTTTSTGGCG